MKYFSYMLVSVFTLLSMVASVHGYSSSSIVSYVDRYCDSLNPITDCGIYERDVQESRAKGTRILSLLNAYSVYEQQEIIDELTDVLGGLYDSASNSDTKFLAAYYYLFFMDMGQSDTGVDDVLSFLFDDTRTRTTNNGYYFDQEYAYEDDDYYYYYEDDYDYGRTSFSTYAAGEITNLRSAGEYTRVLSYDQEITVQRDRLSLGIRAASSKGTVLGNRSDYRVVAVRDGRYGTEQFDAYFNSRDGYWTIDTVEDFSDNDELTIYLLCDDCSGNQTYAGRTIADEEVYEIDVDTGRSNFGDYYTDNDEDLALRDLSYEYYTYARDIVVEIEIEIHNEGRDEVELEDIEFDIESDNDHLSSRDYDIEYVDADCDDSYVTRYDPLPVEIEEDDVCTFIVELTFDEDDVLYEDMEIEVTLDADDDENSSNDSEYIRFRVD